MLLEIGQWLKIVKIRHGPAVPTTQTNTILVRLADRGKVSAETPEKAELIKSNFFIEKTLWGPPG